MIPKSLDVTTDVVGYPIHSNFNVNRYFQLYYFVVLLFPALTYGIYRFLPRLETFAPGLGSPLWIAGSVAVAARLLLVGMVFGIATSIVAGASVAGWGAVLSVASAYALGVALVGIGAGYRLLPRMPAAGRIAAANALAASLTLIALYGISSATRVVVAADGTVHHYPWLPLWAAICGAVAIAIIFGRRIGRSHGLGEAQAIERVALTFVVGPVLLFLNLASLPGDPGPLDMFSDGEGLVAAKLVLGGLFPWRDLFFIHGLTEDVVRTGIGFVAFENSWWGAVAGIVLLGAPLYWVSMYFLNAYLYRRSWPFLLLTAALMGTMVTGGAHFRFILQPIVYLLLAALLAKATRWRAVAFALTLVVQAILTPEASYAIPACGAIVFAYELVHRRRSASMLDNFHRTVWSLAAGAAVLLVWFTFLGINGAAGDFVYYYRTFVPDHSLTGGIPFRAAGPLFLWFVSSPALLILLSIAYFAAHARNLLALGRDDWVMGSAAILLFLYYPKFLNRADEHVYHVYAVAVPLLFYAMFKGASAIDAAINRRAELAMPTKASHAVAFVTLLIAVLPLLASPLARPADFAYRFAPTVPEEPWLGRLGFAIGSQGVDRGSFIDLDSFFRANLRPGDRVFDFSNEPALLYYLLDLRPSTRYFHVSMAIRENTQLDLIAQLRRDPPRFVIFDNDRFGLGAWDGIPNSVRHYLVSQYLLDNYRPFTSLHGQLLMTPKDEGSDTPTLEPANELYFAPIPCDWGYAPNFLRYRPSADEMARSVELRLRTNRALIITGWAADPGAGRPAVEVIAVIDGAVAQRSVPKGDRADVAAALKNEGVRRSGYEIVIPLPEGSTAPKLNVYAVSVNGVASELAYGPKEGFEIGGPLATIVDSQGVARPVASGATIGWVDSSRSTSFITVDLPPGRTSNYRWLEIESATPFVDDTFTLSDQVTSDRHSIRFKTLGRAGTRYYVAVGSCSQWHGYSSGTLFLTSTSHQAISTIRLLP